MRNLAAALTVMAMAAFGTALPVSTAHAAAAADCYDAWYGEPDAGYMYAYDSANCIGFLGKAKGSDSNWGDSSGSFQGGDTNKATSILNAGTDLEVQFFNGTSTWTGGYICLARSEWFASNLSDDEFSSGVTVNNAISSHRWVTSPTCGNNWAE
ncbi:hypothetical protein OHS59_00170 [Streptomyces sp. NBC_00414]|uniref:hypothetical protein n=1 Tax=Streptomyces sp. NBC_00414 TaxID=2975739 RepID=UPI002E23ADDA